MKFVMIGDTHYGARQDNPAFYDYQKKFFDNVLFPYMEQKQIHNLIHLGDLVDNRTKLSYLTKSRLEADFLEPLREINTTWIVGNHDIFYKNTLRINAIRELVGNYSNVYIIDEPTNFKNELFYVPWICSDNREETLSKLKQTDAKICLGHLSLKGFNNGSGYTTEGDDRELFSKFNKVFSGHFHGRSRQGNITYIGAPFQYNWSDVGDYRGFAVYDTKDSSILFIRNPYHIFNIVNYNPDMGFEGLQDTYCRLVVKECLSEIHLRDTIKKIEDVGVLGLTVIDERCRVAAKIGELPQSDDVQKMMHEYIDRNSSKEEAYPIKEKFDKLYTEAEKELCY